MIVLNIILKYCYPYLGLIANTLYIYFFYFVYRYDELGYVSKMLNITMNPHINNLIENPLIPLTLGMRVWVVKLWQAGLA